MNRHLRPVPPDPESMRVRRLMLRSRRAGYQLVRDPRPPHEWRLLDLADGLPLHTATTLEQIDTWLDE
ncbi:hypothetical protein [Nocardia thraciensis]